MQRLPLVVCLENTYKELKLSFVNACTPINMGLENTYKELKLFNNLCRKVTT